MCMQEIKAEMESSSAYTDIFPALFRLMDDPSRWHSTVERSSRQMRLVKTRLRNRLSNNTLLNKLMRFAVEGPELSTVDFTEI